MLNTALYERTHILVGNSGVEQLQRANIFLCGAGGVGGHCAEALVRAGIGSITICDHDVISSTNKNRQLIALDSTIGKSKVQALCARLRDINVNCRVTAMDAFVLPVDVEHVLTAEPYTHIVDCIDSIDCKVALLEGAVRLGLKVFSSCGAGGRLDPSLVSVGDLFDTENDALARICRNELRRRGIKPGDITVVHSKEKGLPPLEPQRQESGGRDRAINGTISYMPPLFGLLLSSAVIREVIDPSSYEKARVKRQRELTKKEADKAKLGQWKGSGGGGGGGNASSNNNAATSNGKQNKQQQQQQNNSQQSQKKNGPQGAAAASSSSDEAAAAKAKALARQEKKAAACKAYFANKKNDDNNHQDYTNANSTASTREAGVNAESAPATIITVDTRLSEDEKAHESNLSGGIQAEAAARDGTIAEMKDALRE